MAFDLGQLLTVAAQGLGSHMAGTQERKAAEAAAAAQAAELEREESDRRQRRAVERGRLLETRRHNEASEEAERARERRMRLPTPERERTPPNLQRITGEDRRMFTFNPRTSETAPLLGPDGQHMVAPTNDILQALLGMGTGGMAPSSPTAQALMAAAAGSPEQESNLEILRAENDIKRDLRVQYPQASPEELDRLFQEAMNRR